LTNDFADKIRTDPSVPGQGKPAIPAKVRIRTVVIDVIFMRNAPHSFWPDWNILQLIEILRFASNAI
jgi:hypothetical protein